MLKVDFSQEVGSKPLAHLKICFMQLPLVDLIMKHTGAALICNVDAMPAEGMQFCLPFPVIGKIWKVVLCCIRHFGFDVINLL